MSEPDADDRTDSRSLRDLRLCIAHAGDVTDPSGGTDRVTALAAGLEDRGATVSLVVPTASGPFPDPLAGVGVRTATEHDSGLATAVAVARTAKRVAAETDAVVQFEHSVLGGIGALVGCSDYLLDVHDLAYSRYDHVETSLAPVLRGGVRRLERLAVRRARHVVAVSEPMRSELVGEWGVAPRAVSVVPNGYRPERVAGVTARSPVPGRVSFLGTLHPKVDVDALSAVASLSAVSELCVIGDGALRERLERLADRPGYESLRVTGRLPDAEAFDLVADSQLVVNPQHDSLLQRVSSPVKLSYYAALGVPIVATAGPAPARDLAETGAACLVEPGGDFAGTVSDLLGDPDRRELMGGRGRAAAADMTWDDRVDAFATVCAETLMSDCSEDTDARDHRD